MEAEFQAQFDARHRVLLVTAGALMTRAIHQRIYDAVKRFVAAQGPCSLILDLAAVSDFALSFEFLREIAEKEPVVPAPMRRIVVAPQPAVFGSVRIIETLRSETAAPV